MRLPLLACCYLAALSSLLSLEPALFSFKLPRFQIVRVRAMPVTTEQAAMYDPRMTLGFPPQPFGGAFSTQQQLQQHQPQWVHAVAAAFGQQPQPQATIQQPHQQQALFATNASPDQPQFGFINSQPHPQFEPSRPRHVRPHNRAPTQLARQQFQQPQQPSFMQGQPQPQGQQAPSPSQQQFPWAQQMLVMQQQQQQTSPFQQPPQQQPQQQSPFQQQPQQPQPQQQQQQAPQQQQLPPWAAASQQSQQAPPAQAPTQPSFSQPQQPPAGAAPTQPSGAPQFGGGGGGGAAGGSAPQPTELQAPFGLQFGGGAAGSTGAGVPATPTGSSVPPQPTAADLANFVGALGTARSISSSMFGGAGGGGGGGGSSAATPVSINSASLGGMSNLIPVITTLASAMPSVATASPAAAASPVVATPVPAATVTAPSSSSISIAPTRPKPTSCTDNDFPCQFEFACWACYADHSLPFCPSCLTLLNCGSDQACQMGKAKDTCVQLRLAQQPTIAGCKLLDPQ